jgi:hypothetical protein
VTTVSASEMTYSVPDSILMSTRILAIIDRTLVHCNAVDCIALNGKMIYDALRSASRRS